jgi:6-phosphogluconolactonase
MNGSARVRLLVGSYTNPVPHSPGAHGDGIQMLELDLSTGITTTSFECRAVPNPAFLTVHPTLPVVYAVSERWDVAGAVHVLRLGPDGRSVQSHNEFPSGGMVPSYASVIDDFLLVSHYGDASLVSYRLDQEGEPVEQVSVLKLSGSGPNQDRQKESHPHCIVPHPTNGSVYAADLGADTVMQLSLDRTDGTLVVMSETSTTPGSGPRHLAFSPSGKTAFVVEELSSTLAVFALGPGGELRERQRLPMTPDDSTVSSFGADLVIRPDGRKVFASNRGHNSVVTYDVEPDEGLRINGWTPTGDTPRGLGLTPDGGHLLVGNQEDDTIQVLAVTDYGLVERFNLPAATPTCLRPMVVASLAPSARLTP